MPAILIRWHPPDIATHTRHKQCNVPYHGKQLPDFRSLASSNRQGKRYIIAKRLYISLDKNEFPDCAVSERSSNL